MESELSIHETPVCGGAEDACEVIGTFLDNSSEVIEDLKEHQEYKRKRTENKALILEKQEMLKCLREKQEKLVIEIYLLKNNLYNG